MFKYIFVVVVIIFLIKMDISKMATRIIIVWCKLLCSAVRLSFPVTFHPLYSMNKFVTNKSKLPQDGAQVFPYKG